MSSDSASVNSTSARLSVATTRRAGESSADVEHPSPAGPSAAPSARNTATCGMSLRSISPENSAAIIDHRADQRQHGHECLGVEPFHTILPCEFVGRAA